MIRYLALAMILSACDRSWQDRTRDALSVVSAGVTAGAESTASGLRRDCSRPGQGSSAVHDCMRERGYDLAFATLLGIDSTAAVVDDLIEAEKASSAPSPQFLRAVACLAHAVGEARAGLTVAHVDIPTELLTAVDLLSAFVGAQCAGAPHE